MSVFLDSQKILDFIVNAANGVDNIRNGVVGSNGYGFLFKARKYISNYFEIGAGGKIYPLGSMKDFAIDLETKKIKELTYFFSDEEGHYKDIEIIGSLKTLVPDMEFGDPDMQDIMFDVWIFTKTPNGKIFPVALYYGPTRLALGERGLIQKENSIFTSELENLINYDPLELSKIEKKELVIALELALMKVPTSDFLGVLRHDEGYRLMGINNGKTILNFFPPTANIRFFISSYNFELKNNKIVRKS